MKKSRWIGLLVAGCGLLVAAVPASAQYPGYAQPAPAFAQPAPVYQGQTYGGQTYGTPPVAGPPTATAPVIEGGGHVVTGEGPVVVGGEGPVVIGGDGQAVPYSEDFGNGPQGLGYPGFISNDGGDQLYPYDQQDPWLHGYWQEIPAYGGYAHFRPYNYRHVLSQTQAAAGWGLDPTMAYSQQFWHRYHTRAALEHCPVPTRSLESPNAELDPEVEAERLRREVRERERRLRNLERNGY